MNVMQQPNGLWRVTIGQPSDKYYIVGYGTTPMLAINDAIESCRTALQDIAYPNQPAEWSN